jgi:hypothetical protein
MTFGTIRFFITVFVCWAAVAGAIRTPAAAQLRMSLDFDEGASVVLRRDAYTAAAETLSAEWFRSAGLTLSNLDPCPTQDHYLVLDGIDDFLKVPSYADINVTGQVAFTVTAWIYLPSLTSGEIINAGNNFLSGYRFYLEANEPHVEIREGLSETFRAGYVLRPQRWYHIGFHCDGASDSLTFYINGAPVTMLPFSRITQANTGAQSYVGAAPSSSPPGFLRANLDGLRFFVGLDTIFGTVRDELLPSARSPRKNKSDTPALFRLEQNYPNPFNLSTTIAYDLRKSGYVELRIYDLLGNLLRTLYEGDQEIGYHEYTWNATDQGGSVLPSGIYFVRLSLDGDIQTKKMILVK